MFARNMLSWSWRSIKLLLLHLVGVPYYFTYNYAALKIIYVGIFLYLIKISSPVHFLFKWRQNLSARPRIISFFLASRFHFLDPFAQSQQAHISFVKAESLSVLPSVHLFTCVSVAHTERISVKFDSGDFEEDLSRNSKFGWKVKKI
jgi:hypothetical protein